MVAEKKYNVTVPDLDYYLNLINCRAACPINTPAGDYVRAIYEGNSKRGYEIASEVNPLVSICGMICAHPCEDACRRGKIDGPVSIRGLKRFVCEKSRDEGEALPLKRKTGKNGVKVAVVGSGPAGLSCASELMSIGYDVTLFEAAPVLGGMLRLGIPEYRLPRIVVELEIDRILKMGVELKASQRLGKEFDIDDLFGKGFKAVFVAIGAHKSTDIGLQGRELDGVLSGVDFLLNVNLGYSVNLGEKVIVIGGGNVAIDIARTAIRGEEQEQMLEDGSTSMDAARMAIRMGAKEVHVLCLESREQMPAFQYEVDDAEKEGVILHPSKGPKRIVGEEGKVVGLETLDVESIFDSKGRFNPAFVKDSESILSSDTIILAVGQSPDTSWLEKHPDIELNPRGTIKINNETLETTRAGVFAGGDVAYGPRIVIEAVADGKKAAHSIHKYLGGKEVKQVKARFVELDSRKYEMPEYYEKIQRQEIPSLPIDRRIGFSVVEVGYDDEASRTESSRCLDCKVNTIFDSNKCVLCGGCVDVCPENCLRLAEVDSIDGDEKCMDIVGKRTASFAIIKDEERCIRCGLCMKRCPTKAITMEAFELTT